MAQDANNLVWLDMEMTGLEPERERIIELAMIVTDSNLETIAESPVWVVHQSDAQLDAMDDWNKKTHGGTGLIERVRASSLDEAAVEAAALAFVREYVPERTSPMCGNSIGQDRRFMVRYMPLLEAFHLCLPDRPTQQRIVRDLKEQLATAQQIRTAVHSRLKEIEQLPARLLAQVFDAL